MDLDGHHPLRPIVAAWLGKIDRARQARQKFDEVASDCMNFYAEAHTFLWDANYKHKPWKQGRAVPSPTFRISIQKAFEFVSIYGPALYARNPIRQVNPRKADPFDPQLLEMLGDPMLGQMLQQFGMEEQATMASDVLRAQLMERYLNYTPNELPGGGLKQHAETAIFELLVKGRGLLWTDQYTYPDGRKIIGSFHDRVSNLFIDPDAEKLDEAWWIARRRTAPTWDVERKFRLPNGSLSGKGHLQSGNSQGEEAADDLADAHRKQGASNDLITYFEIYSKMGVGGRMVTADGRPIGLESQLKENLDRVCGDYCYLAVARDVPYPLNLPTEQILEMDDDQFRGACRWPIPFWRDALWPVTSFEFYQRDGSPYPLSPLAPGLGELKFLTTMMSHLAHRIWSSSRDFIAVLKAASSELKQAIQSGEDLSILELESAVGGDINKVVQFLQQPQTNLDVWKIMEAAAAQFDKRVGLSEYLYGGNPQGTQSRTALDASVKREGVSTRPEYMANKVEDALTAVARREAMAVRWMVEPEDIVPLMGPTAGVLWQKLITDEPVEKVTAEMEYRIEAGSARKPNKDRDVANAYEGMQILAPIFDNHANLTGDTAPLNALIGRWLKATEMDKTGLEMGPRTPAGPSPEEQQQMMQQQQEQQQAEMAMKQADLQGKQIDVQAKVLDSQLKQREAQVGMAMQAAEGRQKLAQNAQEHRQKMQFASQEQLLSIKMQKEKNKQAIADAKAKRALMAKQPAGANKR